MSANRPAAAPQRFARLSLAGNVLYAVYHGALGVWYGSLWFLALCAFYSILAVVRLDAMLCGRRETSRPEHASGVFVMYGSGLMLLLLSAALAGIVFISLSQHRATAYGEITMIAIAAYTFSKITAAAVRAVRRRRDPSPVCAVLCRIGNAEAAASVVTLQRSMLVSFGHADPAWIDRMNAMTGAAACLLILAFGIRLIQKARKEAVLCQSQIL